MIGAVALEGNSEFLNLFGEIAKLLLDVTSFLVL
jgi:hypothetical protein